MKYTPVVLVCLALTACSLFEHAQQVSDIEKLSQDVLKKGEGVEIDVKPIPKP